MRLWVRCAALLLCLFCITLCLQCGTTIQIFGQTVNWVETTVNSTAAVRPTVVEVADFDGDGMLDIVAGYQGAGSNQPAVFVFFQDDPNTWVPVQIGSGANFSGVVALAIGDLDNDGRTDVVAACNGALMYLHSPATPRTAAGWTATAIAQSNDAGIGQWSDVAIADIDLANGLDVVASNLTKGWVSWFVNPGNAASGTGWTGVQIAASGRSGSAAVALDDVDGDGKTDVFSSAPGETSGKIVWFKNPPAAATDSWTRNTIGNMPGCTHMAVGDLDGDGFNDLVVFNNLTKQVGWYQHPSPLASPWTGYVLTQFTNPTDSPPVPVDVKVAHVNLTTQLDVIVATKTPGRLRWFIPVGTAIGAQKNPWGENNIDDFTQDVGRIAVGDINGDGKSDIVAPLQGATTAEDSIAWFANPS